MTLLSFGSYFKGLFTVEGAETGSALSYLPMLITAVAVGVILAALYFTFWRSFESKLLKRLREAGADCAADAVSLESLGYKPGSLSLRFARFLLRSPSCVLYKTVSCDELDRRNAALLLQAEQPVGEEIAVPTAAPAGEAAPPCEETTATDAKEPEAEPDCASKAEAKQKKRAARAALRRMAIVPGTRFYIQPPCADYAEGHAGKFSFDDRMGLVYTILVCGVLWFVLLNVLDPLVSWLSK